MARGKSLAGLAPAWSAVPVGALPLDTMSMPPRLDALRWKQNMQTTITGELQSRTGFLPLYYNAYTETEYVRKNVDLRWQGNDPRARIDLLAHVVASNGQHYLFASASPFDAGSSLARGAWLFNATTHEWREIQLPDTDYKWSRSPGKSKIAVHKDQIVYINQDTKPFAIELATGQSRQIDSLISAQYGMDPVSRAKVVLSHRGMVILMNLRMGGADAPTRILWSDINRLYFGTQELDGIAPVTGWQDLEYGDPIVAAAELGDEILIYTENAIWSMRFAPTTNSVWVWRRLYHDPIGRKGLLAYPNSLVSDGKHHYYIGRDGIYRFGVYFSEPERLQDATIAAGMMFHQHSAMRIDILQPDLVIGARIAGTDEIWWSWKPAGEPYHKWTFAYNPSLRTADYIDHGFSALSSFVRYGVSESIPVGVSALDNTVKQLNAGYARYIYKLESPKNLIPYERPRGSSEAPQPPSENNPTKAPVAHGYGVYIRGFVPGSSGNWRMRLLGVKVDVGRVYGSQAGIGFRFYGSTRIPEAAQDRFITGTSGPDIVWKDGDILAVHSNMSYDTLLEIAQQVEGVYIIYELSVGNPKSSRAIYNSQVTIGRVWFETVALGYSVY